MGLHGDGDDHERESRLAALRPLGRQFPGIDAAVAEIARLSAELTLPRRTVHVVSDVHGEDAKLRHVINNASGTLRPLVERLFAERLAAPELQDLLSLIFYPREMLDRVLPQLGGSEAVRACAGSALRNLFEIVRALARRRTHRRVQRVFPAEYATLFEEMLSEPSTEREGEYADAIVDSLVRHDRVADAIRLAVHVLRDLAIDELVVAGDCCDRGPRADRVVDYLQRQPDVSFTWGNHDAAWIGAGLGQEALIAHVLRISLRYRRLSQLEEGYGITLQPLEHLVRTVYADDPAECFVPRGDGLREVRTMARMQKAAAIMQFKLEGQTIGRNPEMDLEHRCLLHRIDRDAGYDRDRRQDLSAARHVLPNHRPGRPVRPVGRGAHLHGPPAPVVPRQPAALGSHALPRPARILLPAARRSPDLPRLRAGRRAGEFLAYEVDGGPRSGRALFEAIDRVVLRALEQPAREGPRPALVPVVRAALAAVRQGPNRHPRARPRRGRLGARRDQEPVLPADPRGRLLRAGAAGVRRRSRESGLIVNGHVPVKIEKGESPLKRSGKAITIDGAFSEAYGDHGYTLVLDADRTFLAQHHHFDSVEAAVRDGVDIIPTITMVREYRPPRRIGDTERGVEIRSEIALLESLVEAYRSKEMQERLLGL